MDTQWVMGRHAGIINAREEIKIKIPANNMKDEGRGKFFTE